MVPDVWLPCSSLRTDEDEDNGDEDEDDEWDDWVQKDTWQRDNPSYQPVAIWMAVDIFM